MRKIFDSFSGSTTEPISPSGIFHAIHRILNYLDNCIQSSRYLVKMTCLSRYLKINKLTQSSNDLNAFEFTTYILYNKIDYYIGKIESMSLPDISVNVYWHIVILDSKNKLKCSFEKHFSSLLPVYGYFLLLRNYFFKKSEKSMFSEF